MSIVTGFKTKKDGQIYDLGELFQPGSSSYTTHMKSIGGQDIGNLFQGYTGPIKDQSYNTIYTVNITNTYYNLTQLFEPFNLITVISGPAPQIINNSGIYSLQFSTVGTTIFTINISPISNITGYIIGAGGGGSSNNNWSGGGGGESYILNTSYITNTQISVIIGAGGAVNTHQADSTTIITNVTTFTALGGYGGTNNTGGNGGGTLEDAGHGETNSGAATSGISINPTFGGGGGANGNIGTKGGGGGVAFNFPNLLPTSLPSVGGAGGIQSSSNIAQYHGGVQNSITRYGGGGYGGGSGGNGCALLQFTIV
jgi:hypothetical protein